MVLIGLVLTSVAVLLVYESKMLLVGESADVESVRSIRKLVEFEPAVASSGPPLTMHLGPKDVLLNLDVQFQEGLSTEDLVQAVDRLEQAIREKHPEMRRMFLEIERFRRRDGRPARSLDPDACVANGSSAALGPISANRRDGEVERASIQMPKKLGWQS